MHKYTKTLRRTGFLVSCLALAATGCGVDDSPGRAAAGSGGTAGAGSASGGESGTSGAGGHAGSASCGTTDEPDAAGSDENCDGADGIVGTDVYVSVSGSDTNPGTPDAPLKTITKALEFAHSRSGRVLVAAGGFDIVAISQPGDLKVHGGYPLQFVGKREASATSLKASSPEGIVVSEADSVHFETLTIAGVSAKEATQRSSQALILDVPNSKLVDVRVIAGDAISGSSGVSGTSGGPGKDGNYSSGTNPTVCNGKQQPGYTGGVGRGEKNSAGGSPGSCEQKKPAAAGAHGIHGTDGANASPLPTFENGALRWPDAFDALDDAQPGFGGAGGGTCKFAAGYGMGSRGGGSGGCPGTPGTKAESGGGAIGVVVLSGTLVVERSLIRTGFGGDGGDGGAGGSGGPGGKSMAPSCPSWLTECMAFPEIPLLCQPATDPWKVNCAHWGGTGGPGGDGGHGGGGVGGSTVGILTLGAATSEFDAATTFELGVPGKGGEGSGGARAANGEKRKQWALAAAGSN